MGDFLAGISTVNNGLPRSDPDGDRRLAEILTLLLHVDCRAFVPQYPPMNPEIHSERLTIRPLARDDIDMLLEVFTDAEIMRFTGGPKPEAKLRSEMTDSLRRGGDGCLGIWCIVDRASGEKLGTLALLPMPIDTRHTDYSLVRPGYMPDGYIEIGYFLKRSAWGKGLAVEACRRLLQAVFEDSILEEVVATTDPGNAASRRVLEKSGFTDLGLRRSYGNDGPFFRITKTDWLQAQRDS